MARITTVWDNVDGVNTKVFMVRGEEAYARTTNIKISLKSSTTDAVNGFVPTAVVDVLRDTGTSSITFFDGDDVLTVVDWSYTDSNKEITLPRLSWDVEHKIWAKYNGNSSCLKSKSETISIQKVNPNLTTTSITNTTSISNYTSSDSITVTATLNKASGSASLQGREIEFFVDGVSKGTANTSNTSGNVSKSIGTLSNGIHEVAVVFFGDNPLGASETKFNVYVGYKLTIVEYPKTFINNINNTVKIKIEDYKGNPVSGKSISFAGKSATSDSNGIATISNVTSITNNTGYYASYSGYTSDTINMKSCTLTGISITGVDNITVNGVVEPITVTISGTGTLGNVPITISGGATGTYMTNNDGSASFDYMGNATGNVTITGTLPDTTLSSSVRSASVVIQDLVYYAKARTFNNTSPKLTRCKLDEQTSAFMITPSDPFQYGSVMFYMPSDVHYWEATFTLVSFDGKYRDGININGAVLNSGYKNRDVITVTNRISWL